MMANVGVIVAHAWQAGYRVYVVHTGSMAPTLQPGDVVVDRRPTDLAAGDVITFRHSDATDDVVTHRIVRVTNGGIRTKGDGNRSADVWQIRPDQVRGVMATTVPHLGYALVFLKQPAGIGAVMTGALALVLLWGV